MKLKKLFALALAVCMVLSAAPVSMAGILSNGNSNGSATGGILSNGSSNGSTGGILSSSTPAQQPDAPSSGGRGILSSNSGDDVYYTPSTLNNTEGGNVSNPAPVVSTGNLDEGKKVESGEVFTTLTNNNTPPSGGAGLNTSPNNGLELKKTVSEAGDKITLEAWVTGEEVTVTVKEGEPVEIILVLDRSARMQVTAENGKTKMENLKAAATDFLTAVQAKSPKSRVAIVSYANDNGSTVDSGTKVEKVGALVPITEINEETKLEQVNSNLTDAIGALVANGNAYSDEALGKAAKILQDLTKEEPTNNHKRMVILFTAGIPGTSTNTSWDNNAYKIAQASIHWGVILKAEKTTSVNLNANQEFYSGSLNETDMAQYTGYTQGCEASVFCVGIDLDNCVSGHYHGSADAACNGTKINEYLYRISSHREDGSHVGCQFDVAHLFLCNQKNFNNPWETEPKNASFLIWTKTCWTFNYLDQYTRGNVSGSKVTGTKYYQAGDIKDVGSMFNEISNDITTGGSSNEALTTETIVKDVISPYFQIPADGTVTAYSVAYLGNNAWDDTASKTYAPTITGNTVTVDGFNFSDNWVGTANGEAHGEKLVIEIDIEPKTGFLGGQGIPTNDDTQAGVYLGKTLVENFPSSAAKTDITIPPVTVDVKNKNVYLSNEMSDADMLSDAVVKIGDTVLDLHEENFGLEAWQYAFLSEIKVVATEDASSFNATCTVTDQAGNTKSGTDATAAQITVFKPVLTFKDSTIYLGQTPDYEEQNYGDPLFAWMHNTTNAETVTMTGGRPSLDVEFTEPDDFTVCRDISVKSVQLNGEGNYVTLTTVQNGDKDYFTVHVVEPVATFQDSTIYLGYTPNQNDFEDYNIVPESIAWKHTADDGNAQPGDIKPEVKYSFVPTSDYNDCTTVKATVSSGGVVNSQGERAFTVHVIQPTITFADQDIYLSDTPVYAEPGFAWNQLCADKCEGKIPAAINKTDTQTSFAYAYSVDPAPFTQCTDVNVSVEIGTTDYTQYVTLKNGDTTRNVEGKEHEFTVHVYLPQIVLEGQNLWADYDYDVTLTDGMKDATISEWSNQCNSNEKKEHSTSLPQCSDPVYKFTLNGVEITSYNAKDEEILDQSTIGVALVTIKVGGNVYEFKNVAPVEYTVTVNKFDLTINKEWNGNAIYKQDAIFDLYHLVTVEENGKQVEKPIPVSQVVLPTGQNSVTVSGLLCGQDYTVTEADDWTWRWDSDDAEQEVTGASHEVSTSDPHGENGHTETVSFVNTLVKELWLSFCTFVRNIFGQDAIQKGGSF